MQFAQAHFAFAFSQQQGTAQKPRLQGFDRRSVLSDYSDVPGG
jgi:hypothetical protein